MAYVLEIIQYKKLGQAFGKRLSVPCMGKDNQGNALVKKTQVSAAGLSAALDTDTKLVRVRNLTGSQLAYVRFNVDTDTTNAAAAEAQSESLSIGQETTFMPDPRVLPSRIKIDIR